MTPKSENPSGAAGVSKNCHCGGSCKQSNLTTPAPPRQLPKIHRIGRRAIENLKFEILERGDLDQTEASAVRAVEFLLKNC
ncbi:MAG: hypothetical protein ACYCYJ_18460 [Trichloromonadaceae bacterium]